MCCYVFANRDFLDFFKENAQVIGLGDVALSHRREEAIIQNRW